MTRMFFIVGLGSFIGGGLRYLSQQYISRLIADPFPYGTFFVNILGSFIIGILFSISEKADVLSTEMRFFLVTGLCGGFTTFSSFSLEIYNLMRDGSYVYAGTYVGLSILLGLAATYLGILLIKII